MFESSNVAYLKPSSFNNIPLILGIVYGLRFNFLFIFLKSLRKRTRFVLALGYGKDGAAHSESFDISSTTSRTKFPTSFLNISSCTFDTGCGI